MSKQYAPAQPADHRYTNNLHFQNAEALFITLNKSIYKLNSGLFDNAISLQCTGTQHRGLSIVSNYCISNQNIVYKPVVRACGFR
jgi:hypothetical protein